MAGVGVLLRKELLEQWRTLRLPLVAVVFAAGRPRLAAPRPVHAGDPQGGRRRSVIPIVLPTPTAADAVDQLAKNLSQLGALVAILLASGSVAAEKERGTAALILVRPVGRGAVPRREDRGDRRHARRSRSRSRPPRPGSTRSSCSSRCRSPGRSPRAPSSGSFLMAWAAVTFLASTLTRSSLAAAGLGVVALIVDRDPRDRARRSRRGCRRPGRRRPGRSRSGSAVADAWTPIVGDDRC